MRVFETSVETRTIEHSNEARAVRGFPEHDRSLPNRTRSLGAGPTAPRRRRHGRRAGNHPRTSPWAARIACRCAPSPRPPHAAPSTFTKFFSRNALSDCRELCFEDARRLTREREKRPHRRFFVQISEGNVHHEISRRANAREDVW